MQTDGNWVMYDYEKTVLWNAGSVTGTERAPYTLIMQDDRNIVIYDKDMVPTWDSGTTLM